MKRKLFFMMALAVAMGAQGQVKNDTTIINNARKVTIVTNDSLQKIKVVGTEGNSAYRYENTIQLRDSNYVRRQHESGKGRESWDFDLAVGWCAPTSVPDGMSFAPFKSWEWILGFRYKYRPKKALQTYSVGLWCNWRRYTLSSDYMFMKGVKISGDQSSASNEVGVGSFPKDASGRRSRINIFSLSVPLLFTQRFGQKSDWRFTVGPVVNFNLRGRINTEYTLGDYDYDITTKGIEYRPVTVDFMGFVTYKELSIYCKYSPMSVLKTDMGPQFHSLTFGIFI